MMYGGLSKIELLTSLFSLYSSNITLSSNLQLTIILVLFFDLIINQILPENLKKQIGTTKNYSLKSIKFHHESANNINLYEFWGKKKYKVKTNQFAMRISEKENFIIDKTKKTLVKIKSSKFNINSINGV